MNRKGFTLVELITVIVILSLIALVVFPAINTLIKKSREDAYKTQVNTVVKAAKQCSYENSSILPDTTEGAKAELPLECLTDGCSYNGQNIIGGYLNEEEIKNPKRTSENLNGKIVITYSKNQYIYEFVELAS